MKKLIFVLSLLLCTGTLISQDYIAAVQKDKLWGYIDEKGNWIIESKFEKAGDFSEGYAIVKFNGIKYYTDTIGNLYGNSSEYDIFHNFYCGLARVRLGEKWGYIDTSFVIIDQLVFDAAKNFTEDMARVKVGERWGFINKNGEWIKEPVFDRAYEFHCGIAMVKMGETFNFIDKDGKFYFGPTNIRVKRRFSDGLALFEQIDKNGYIDKEFNIFINPIFDAATHFNEGIAAVKQGAKWGYINTKGEWLKEPFYDNANEFYSGIAMVKMNGVWHFADKDFNIIDKGDYQVTHHFSNGLAKVKVGKFWGYVNTKGEIVIDPVYKSVKDFMKIN